MRSRPWKGVLVRKGLRFILLPALFPVTLLWVALLLVALPLAARAADRPNVLMILVDDLKPALGAYGSDFVHSPNLDRLTARGMRFDRAYCNQAVCAPSRNNLMVGLRSTTLGVYGLGRSFRSVKPDAVTLTQYFMRHGYKPEGVGKVFHVGHGNQGDAASWSEPFHPDKVVDYVLEESTGGQLTREEAYFSNAGVKVKDLPRGAAWEKADVDDGAYADGRIAEEGIRRLNRFKQHGEPFFLALGFVKPHLPFCAPSRYWDLYDPFVFDLTERDTPPDGAPPYAGKGRKGEIGNYQPAPQDGDIPDEMARSLIHGYFASLSYMDAQVGRVLDELDRLELAESTLIVLWGDHGWHFGDHGTWTKHTNYEQDNRIPLVFVAPGVAKPGSSTRAFAETVDIYPTLTELAGLPAPNVPQGLDGKSLVSVLKNPGASVRDHAYHAYNRGSRIGRAIRTDRYRMVEWKQAGAPADAAEYELYDYQVDELEKVNLAGSRPDVLARLKAILARHPEAAAEGLPGRRAQHKPNFVFMIADDCTFRDIGCYGGQAHTPNIDRLAAEGMRFTRCFQAAPMCSPTRHNIYTGLYPVKSGAYPNHTRVDPGTRSVVQYLRLLGYRVAQSGKTHVGPGSVFDWEKIPGGKNPQFDQVDAFLAECKDQAEPFCLLLCSNEPHTPWNKGDPSRYPPEEVVLPAYFADTPETRDAMSRYLAEITYYDGQVGEAMRLLDRHGLADDTLLIVVSEQGSSMPFAKWTCYDNGLQSAFLARWPGRIRPGTVNPAMIEYVDLLPTFVEAAGGVPDASLDGRSLLSVFDGKQEHKQFVFGEMTTRGINQGSDHYGIRSVRSDRFKYIWNFTPEAEFKNVCTGSKEFKSWEVRAAAGDERAGELVRRYRFRPEIELYDVVHDPLEMTNLAGRSEHAVVQAALRAELNRWMEHCGDEGQATEMKALERMGRKKEGKRADAPAAQTMNQRGTTIVPLEVKSWTTGTSSSGRGIRHGPRRDPMKHSASEVEHRKEGDALCT